MATVTAMDVSAYKLMGADSDGQVFVSCPHQGFCWWESEASTLGSALEAAVAHEAEKHA